MDYERPELYQMKYPYHVITAFNRWQNLQAMIDLLGPLNRHLGTPF